VRWLGAEGAGELHRMSGVEVAVADAVAIGRILGIRRRQRIEQA